MLCIDAKALLFGFRVLGLSGVALSSFLFFLFFLWSFFFFFFFFFFFPSIVFRQLSLIRPKGRLSHIVVQGSYLLVECSLSLYLDMIQNPSHCHSVSLKGLFSAQSCSSCTLNPNPLLDDTQLNTSFDSCNIDSAIEIIQHCTNDIQSWMVQNKLQLNEGKTEALVVATSSSDKDLPTSIQIGSSVVPFVKSVRNLGVILDWRLSMEEHINNVCQMAYWELRRISSIRQYLTEDAAKP